MNQEDLNEAIENQFEQFVLKVKEKNLTRQNYRIKRSTFDAKLFWKEYVQTYYPGSKIAPNSLVNVLIALNPDNALKSKVLTNKNSVCTNALDCFSVMDVHKNNLLTTFPKWGNVYNVEVDITVNKMPSGQWANIFHFSKNGDCCGYGDRIPAVFINRDGYFRIASAVNGNGDLYIDPPINVGKTYHLKIQQFIQNGKTIYEVNMDGNIIQTMENTNPMDFDNVKVYASSPWWDSFTDDIGKLRNFQYSSNEQKGKYIVK